MNKACFSRHRWLFVLLIVFLPTATGCSVATGNMLTFFPQKQTLHPAADSIRRVAAAQGVMPIARELDKSVTPPYVVEPGDSLLVQPADLDTPVIFPPDQTVLLDGTINLGKYGLVVVAGKTIPEIEAMIRSAVEAYHHKDMGPVTARVVVPDSKVFYVLGEVNSPGAFPLKGRETVLDAIIAAGGLNSRASRHKIILSRPTPPPGCRVVLPICYDQIVQLGDTTTNYQIRPGDRIFVASRTLFEDLFGHHHNKGICTNTPQQPCSFPSPGCTVGTQASWQSTATGGAPFPSDPAMAQPTIGNPTVPTALEVQQLPPPGPEH